MSPIIQIGPATIQSSMLASLVALWLGSLVAEREGKRRGINPDHIWNVIIIGIVATALSARIVFVLQNHDIYASQPSDIFSLTANALSLEYGLVGGVLAGYAYLRWRKIALASFADALAPGALIALSMVSLGQLLSGDAIGTPTNLPWAISLWGDLRHPVQIYVALATLLGAVIVGQLARRPMRAGFIALIAIAWYSATRVFVDAFRADADLLGGGYRVSQVIALAALLIALWAMSRLETRTG